MQHSNNIPFSFTVVHPPSRRNNSSYPAPPGHFQSLALYKARNLPSINKEIKVCKYFIHRFSTFCKRSKYICTHEGIPDYGHVFIEGFFDNGIYFSFPIFDTVSQEGILFFCRCLGKMGYNPDNRPNLIPCFLPEQDFLAEKSFFRLQISLTCFMYV
jgi:hypothetical protein